MSSTTTTTKPAPPPQPSSSVLLLSPKNHVLLLHRVKRSSNFPSAHVFPGGNLDPFHDGHIPTGSERHRDGQAYRCAAVRETFEESGILLAGRRSGGGSFQVGETERLDGRRNVHQRRVRFGTWVDDKGGRMDTEGLLPFTRWVTPGLSATTTKRFSTQMYVYFLPLSSGMNRGGEGVAGSTQETVVPNPTDDGGIEHTSARFLPAAEWLRLARRGDIILFPPQFVLLVLAARFLPQPAAGQEFTGEELERQRESLREFVRTSGWADKVICPMWVANWGDGRRVLSLHDPGEEELRREGLRGESEMVVLARFVKEGPRELEVRSREEVERELGKRLDGADRRQKL